MARAVFRGRVRELDFHAAGANRAQVRGIAGGGDEEPAMKWCLIGLGVLLGGLAIASNLNLSNVKECADKVKMTPQTIKAADLSANGPGDNPYVVLTDFRFRASDVYVSVWKGNQTNMTGTAYFPLELVQKGKKSKKEPETKTPRVVVIASVGSPAGVKAFMNRTTITGIVKG